MIGNKGKYWNRFMPIGERFFEKVNKTAGCWNWIGKSKSTDGYGKFWIDGKFVRAHRFSYEHHIGPIPDGTFVLHRCDNPGCVNPDHLFLGTHTDNMRDMWAKNRASVPTNTGSRHGKSIVDESDVVVIRELHSVGCKQVHLASFFGLCPGAISDIVRRVTWCHVP